MILLARGQKKYYGQADELQNKGNALLDQNGVTYSGSLWTNEKHEFLAELTLEGPSQLLLEQWLEAIGEFR